MEISGQTPRRPAGATPASTLDPRPLVAPPTCEIPTQRTAPARELIATPDPRGGRRRVIMTVAVAVTLALGGGGTALAYVSRSQAGESARQAHSLQVAAQAQVFASEQKMLRAQNSTAFWAKTLADRAAALGAATAALDAARVALAAAPQAGDAARGALQQAIDAASAVVGVVPTASVLTIEAAVDSVTALQQPVTAAQAAWQVAEDARLAAEAAAADAAAQAAAAAQAQAPRTATRAPAAPASGAIAPAPEAPATSAPEFSAGALGGAINAWRATLGLPEMTVSRSAGLVAHAGAMAGAGDIWHSGNDKIVGYVQPASAEALVQAWANSPGHRAWMVRTDMTAMQVGAVVLDNRLYGAVDFS